jgi:hypothetical protein
VYRLTFLANTIIDLWCTDYLANIIAIKLARIINLIYICIANNFLTGFTCYIAVNRLQILLTNLDQFARESRANEICKDMNHLHVSL